MTICNPASIFFCSTQWDNLMIFVSIDVMTVIFGRLLLIRAPEDFLMQCWPLWFCQIGLDFPYKSISACEIYLCQSASCAHQMGPRDFQPLTLRVKIEDLSCLALMRLDWVWMTQVVQYSHMNIEDKPDTSGHSHLVSSTYRTASCGFVLWADQTKDVLRADPNMIEQIIDATASFRSFPSTKNPMHWVNDTYLAPLLRFDFLVPLSHPLATFRFSTRLSPFFFVPFTAKKPSTKPQKNCDEPSKPS